MNLIKYTPELYSNLYEAANRFEMKSALLHRPFIDYYYTQNHWCDLYLLTDDKGVIEATIGVERMPFLYGIRKFILGFGGNFFAAQKGIGYGRQLFMKWMECCDFGIAFAGGTPDSHRILRKQEWEYYSGVRLFYLNRIPIVYPGDPLWRSAIKKLVRLLPRPRIGKYISHISRDAFDTLTIREETIFTEDMLRAESPFLFRFTPTIEYLRWRYSPGLSFVRYRIFRIVKFRERTVGYVILNQFKNRVIVSQCDGTDPRTISYGVLLSLREIDRDFNRAPEVLLASSHPVMQNIFIRFGFKPYSVERPLAIGSLKRSAGIASDTSNWLVNFDWGDNALRMPFLDQQ